MSDAVSNSQFLTKILTSGEKDFEHVSVLKEDTLSTACELTMLILSISVTFNVTCLTATLANTFLFILQGSALADLRCGGRF